MLAASPMATPASAAPTSDPVLPLPHEKALRSSSDRLELPERFDVLELLALDRFGVLRARVVLFGDLLWVRVAMWFPPCWF
jgi:hypothetical protein